jgi:hypothetical protein
MQNSLAHHWPILTIINVKTKFPDYSNNNFKCLKSILNRKKITNGTLKLIIYPIVNLKYEIKEK